MEYKRIEKQPGNIRIILSANFRQMRLNQAGSLGVIRTDVVPETVDRGDEPPIKLEKIKMALMRRPVVSWRGIHTRFAVLMKSILTPDNDRS